MKPDNYINVMSGIRADDTFRARIVDVARLGREPRSEKRTRSPGPRRLLTAAATVAAVLAVFAAWALVVHFVGPETPPSPPSTIDPADDYEKKFDRITVRTSSNSENVFFKFVGYENDVLTVDIVNNGNVNVYGGYAFSLEALTENSNFAPARVDFIEMAIEIPAKGKTRLNYDLKLYTDGVPLPDEKFRVTASVNSEVDGRITLTADITK